MKVAGLRRKLHLSQLCLLLHIYGEARSTLEIEKADKLIRNRSTLSHENPGQCSSDRTGGSAESASRLGFRSPLGVDSSAKVPFPYSIASSVTQLEEARRITGFLPMGG